MNFKVGDEVVVICKNEYYITDYGSIGRIMYIRGKSARVQFSRMTGPSERLNEWHILLDHLTLNTKLYKLLAGVEDE